MGTLRLSQGSLSWWLLLLTEFLLSLVLRILFYQSNASAPSLFLLASHTYITTRVWWYSICTAWISYFLHAYRPTFRSQYNPAVYLHFIVFHPLPVHLLSNIYTPKKTTKRNVGKAEPKSKGVAFRIIARLENEKRFICTAIVLCFVARVTQSPAMIAQLYFNYFDPNSSFADSNHRYTLDSIIIAYCIRHSVRHQPLSLLMASTKI